MQKLDLFKNRMPGSPVFGHLLPNLGKSVWKPNFLESLKTGQVYILYTHCNNNLLDFAGHPPKFLSIEESINLVEVKQSIIPKAGRGVFNHTLETFQIG